MPRKRPARTPQPGARRRRAPRRPDFAAGPETPQQVPEERTDLDGNPIFADDIVAPAATHHFGMTGPVETRPEWIGRTAPEQARRQPGRRTAQLRQSGRSEGAARILAGQLPTFEHSYIARELKQIAVISTVLFAVVIVLALVMR
jgi:hypothetical protein